MKKVWITKYALTEGITERELLKVDDDGQMASVKSDGRWSNGYDLFFGGQWHLTRDEALKRAEVMRTRKIASLEKSIERIKALDFS